MLKLTTRVHYSVKALLDLSLHSQDKPCSVRAIAQRQNLPAPYLEKLLIQLRQAKLVNASRGAHGGYRLAQPPREITLGQILEAVGETVSPLIETAPDATQVEDWVTHSLWKRLNIKLKEALETITLEDLYYDACSWQASQGRDSHFII